MRPARLVMLAALASIATAAPAAAQIGFGGHVVQMSDAFDGTTGVGARLRVGVPLFPISAVLNGEYFFPDCGDGDCSLYGVTIDVNYALPLPLIQPWVGVGWSIRKVEVSDVSFDENGINVGIGAELKLTAFKPFVEIRYEMADAPEKQYLMRIGVMLR